MARRIVSRIAVGRVMHRRRRPVDNRFVYPVFFLLVNIGEVRRLDSWLFGVNRWRPLAFYFRDHGDGGDPHSWAQGQLRRHGIHDCNGPLWLQTFPRVFGYVFNPVSFWYCQRDDGSTGAIIAEVNNTFGDRHCYVLRPDAETGRYQDIRADKQFYVSPFYPVSGDYLFHFQTSLTRPRARIDYYDQGQLQLNTAIWGKTSPWSTAALLSALARQPLLTLGVIVRIHWQALRLWRKGVSLAKRPPDPAEEASR